MASVEPAGRPQQSSSRRGSRRSRTEARLYVAQAVLGLVLAAVNLLGGAIDGVALLLAAAGLTTAVAGFVLWRRRLREARLADR